LAAQGEQHFERKVELIGERIEQQAQRVADRAGRVAGEQAKRAERLSKILE